jgi:hypothetical protein
MLVEINQIEKILEELGEGEPLIDPKHLDAFQKMNEIMEETQREFQVKDKQSQISASKVILTA